MTTPLNVFIYGSCVSRDTADFLDTERFRVVRYVARQSLISAFAPGAVDLDLSRIESSFQRRVVHGDLRGDLVQELHAYRDKIDLLLWDLTDERHGVYVGPDDRVVTRSVEGIAAGIYTELESWEHLDLGNPAHLQRWALAAKSFSMELGRLDLLGRTLFLDVPWAPRSRTGTPTPSSFGTTADEANTRFQAYRRTALDVVGARHLHVSDPYADLEHQWGSAPFHYERAVYRRLAALIEETTENGQQR